MMYHHKIFPDLLPTKVDVCPLRFFFGYYVHFLLHVVFENDMETCDCTPKSFKEILERFWYI